MKDDEDRRHLHVIPRKKRGIVNLHVFSRDPSPTFLDTRLKDFGHDTQWVLRFQISDLGQTTATACIINIYLP